jgi:hypothetical protein
MHGKPSQAFSFAFFAASCEESLLSKFAPKCGCTTVIGRIRSWGQRSRRERSTRRLTRRSGGAETQAFWGIDCDSIGTPSAPFAHLRDASMRTSIACQRRRMRCSTAPLRQDFARCIEPDTGEQQAKSQWERGQGLIRGHRRELVRTRFPGQSKSVHSLLELFWC